MNFSRQLKAPNRSFFLFGPRATGKSTWLKHSFAERLHFDLLRNDVYFTLTSSPTAFRDRVLAQDPDKTWIIVDEVQRIPALLNDVHSLIESHGYRFALSGSSARKLKRGQVNLLAGRALVKHLFPLTAAEYGDAITLEEALEFGTLPSIITDTETRIEQLEAYVGTYLREEIKEEALTRNVQAFGRFLEVAALMNGQVTNLSNLARDAAVPRTTVSAYFDVLIDTLIGNWLPAWMPRAKVKEAAHPKFYFFDCGVVRGIQKLL
ncbi:MAG: ATP-binding protein, partial [Gammaproteobacteria bacterium]